MIACTIFRITTVSHTTCVRPDSQSSLCLFWFQMTSGVEQDPIRSSRAELKIRLWTKGSGARQTGSRAGLEASQVGTGLSLGFRRSSTGKADFCFRLTRENQPGNYSPFLSGPRKSTNSDLRHPACVCGPFQKQRQHFPVHADAHAHAAWYCNA